MAAINLPNNDLTFIHLPKNGGSSVVEWLMNNFEAERVSGHPSLDIIKTYWDVKRSFGIVRNPWARIVSAYFYLQQYKFYWEDNGIKTIDDFPTWDHFVMNLDYELKSWYKFNVNQTKWLGPESIVLRAESLDKDFVQIQDILGCHAPLGYINTSEHNPYHTYYTTKQKDHIAKVFAEDIDTFKYVFR
jgi:hypothetical protein